MIAATGGASYLTNEHLRVYNDLMQQVAEEKQVVFLDLEPEFTGPDRQLPRTPATTGPSEKGLLSGLAGVFKDPHRLV